jgi:hypothetical protein
MENKRVNKDPTLYASLTEDHIDHLDEVAENRGISRSALMRKWLAAGERAELNVIPDFDDTPSGSPGHRDPVEQLFHEELPDTTDEAVSIDEMRSKLKDKIDGEVMKLYRDSDKIAVTEGGDIYADDK